MPSTNSPSAQRNPDSHASIPSSLSGASELTVSNQGSLFVPSRSPLASLYDSENSLLHPSPSISPKFRPNSDEYLVKIDRRFVHQRARLIVQINYSFSIFQDRSGKLASGAIANLVDEIGCAVIYDKDLPEPVSVDMSISYMSSADVDVRIIPSLTYQILFKIPKLSKQQIRKMKLK